MNIIQRYLLVILCNGYSRKKLDFFKQRMFISFNCS